MTHKLLLADDSVTIQRVIELTFSGEDVQVIAVGDGELAIARIPIEKPDIVLADIGMPKRNGYEVSAFVKEHPELSHVPVLLLAGAFEPVDEVRAKGSKCDGVLVKPFEPQQVIARVRELIDRRKASADSPVAPTASPLPPPPGPIAPVATPVAPSSSQRAATPSPLAPTPDDAAPKLPTPEIGVAGAEQPTKSLDDYFERLDAAFATLGSTPPSTPAPVSPSAEREDVFDLPTVDDVLAGASLHGVPAPAVTTLGRIAPPPAEPPDSSPTLSPAATPHTVAEDATPNPIANVFNLLFAIEQGEEGAATLRIGSAPATMEVTDELVDEVTRRVLQRLAPDAAHTLVADIVSDIAERLVREEIARIRNVKNG